jgi:hypothetical protein
MLPFRFEDAMVDIATIEPIEAAETAPAWDNACDFFFPEMVRLARREAQEILDGLTFDEAGTTESDRSCRAAVDGWDGPGWREAAVEYHKQPGGRMGAVEIEPDRLARLHRLMERNVSLDRAWAELNRMSGRAADASVGALMFGFRSRGVSALEEPDTLRRLSQLSDGQLREVAVRLQKLKPEIAPAWTPEWLEVLAIVRSKL